ncbi:recQ-mediated genome instability protein 2 isoform X1 [Neopsephotus bourkii]|uniref:recQ-mediated genome instability protein 2 isoform X1 n=1 Tax=Neopsephotus bourkii TaxID=309878 RepID=UPI002AA5159E|nr:recQ-mediated genome instability protein 2 isoform X1 [Neopsephotus bourkii]XP_061232064.1 recQ-mediated genome instability protein 2 isoform X1 [Neopsephotus bourkii]XP_061232065.1 recQ-mediated genome instability protein 2 isoform X1 [Neopsephotus bourkii]XP_061232066.1 recQ-mediated genome instability protein 2 isoform X1 [Neopsephotus bourkii]
MTGLRGRQLLYPPDREWLLRPDLLRRAHQNDQRGGLRGRAPAAAGLQLPACLRGDTAACVTAQPCSRQPGKVLQPYWSWSLKKVIWKPAVHPIPRAASNTGKYVMVMGVVRSCSPEPVLRALKMTDLSENPVHKDMWSLEVEDLHRVIP